MEIEFSLFVSIKKFLQSDGGLKVKGLVLKQLIEKIYGW